MAFNLAERAIAAGRKTVLIDYDPQEGSLGLLYLRGDHGWTARAGRVSIASSDELAGMKARGDFEVIICDLPGADSMALAGLLRNMDLIISPVGLGASDLLTAANFRSLARQFDLPVVFLLNNVPIYRSRREELQRELDKLGVEVCPLTVQRRVAHLDALRDGLGVCEFLPESKAALEIDHLWSWVQARVGLR